MGAAAVAQGAFTALAQQSSTHEAAPAKCWACHCQPEPCPVTDEKCEPYEQRQALGDRSLGRICADECSPQHWHSRDEAELRSASTSSGSAWAARTAAAQACSREPDAASSSEAFFDSLSSGSREPPSEVSMRQAPRRPRSPREQLSADRLSEAHEVSTEVSTAASSSAQSSFLRVNLRKLKKDTHLGLKLDMTEGSHIHIIDIIDRGSVWYYNQHVPDSVQIRPGDFIMAVNGEQGDAISLVRELRGKEECELEISRPRYWDVQLSKSDGESWGLVLSCAPGTNSLVITKVIAGCCGAAAVWNLGNPKAAIKVGDRILAINGMVFEDADQMLDVLSHTNSLTLEMSRPLVSSRGRDTNSLIPVS